MESPLKSQVPGGLQPLGLVMSRRLGPCTSLAEKSQCPLQPAYALAHTGLGTLFSCGFYYRIANEKLGNKLREQVKYIAKLTDEKE